MKLHLKRAKGGRLARYGSGASFKYKVLVVSVSDTIVCLKAVN